MRDTFIRTMAECAAVRDDILLITGDLGFGVFEDFAAQFPRQFLNIGIAEQNMAGVAAGAALSGRCVFTYSIGNFPTVRCLEQIRNDICYHNANVKVVCIGGGMSYGAVGMSHHATEDLAIMRSLANMLVLAPGDLWEAAGATRALAAYDGPGYLRLDKSHAQPTTIEGEQFQVGKARRIREGRDATLIASGGILGEVMKAADMLAREHIECRVLSVHTLKPLDVDALVEAAADTNCIVTVEEHAVEGGLGGAVAEALLEAGAAPARFTRMGLRNTFSSIVGSQSFLREKYGLDACSIANTVRTARKPARNELRRIA